MSGLEQLFDKIAKNAVSLWPDGEGEVRLTRVFAVHRPRWFAEVRVGDGGDEDLLYAEAEGLEMALTMLLRETELKLTGAEE